MYKKGQKPDLDDELNQIFQTTTIVSANVFPPDGNSIYGPETYMSKYMLNQGHQVDIKSLEPFWGKKFTFFGNDWNKVRQLYRYIYVSFKLFYDSFTLLNNYRNLSAINIREKENLLLYNGYAGTALYGIYHHGKKCLDLINKLEIPIIGDDKIFVEKFIETRNKFIEHNHNPKTYNLGFEPSIWSLIGTNPILEIAIHTPDSERIIDAHVDYYDDYYKLEMIMVNIIKGF